MNNQPLDPTSTALVSLGAMDISTEETSVQLNADLFGPVVANLPPLEQIRVASVTSKESLARVPDATYRGATE